MSAFARIGEHTIYTGGCGPASVIVDIGANHGRFSGLMREFCRTSFFYLIEANPWLVEELRTTQPFPVLHYAVGETDGHVLLNIARNDQASSILKRPRAGASSFGTQDQARVPSATFEAILSSLPQRIFDVVKIDIEGAEVFALRDVSRDMLRRIRQMTVEFHSHPMFGLDIHAEVDGIIARLRSEGFLILDFSFGARTDVLILNREQLRIPRARAVLWQLCLALPVRLRPVVRYVPVGLRRWVAPHFKSLVTGSK